MIRSTGRRVRRQLWGAVERHPKAALAAWGCGITIGLLVIVFWPGGAPVAVPIAGALLALAAGVVVPWLLDRRSPHFLTRDDVERVLQLSVLATYARPFD